MRRSVLAVIAFTSALSVMPARPAEAVQLRLGLGADYWLQSEGLFDVDFEITQAIASILSVGGRFGVALVSQPVVVGVPIDLLMRVAIGNRVYIEGTAGPWIFFDNRAAVVTAHVGLGFGLEVGGLSFGPEVGWLNPVGYIGVKLSFRL